MWQNAGQNDLRKRGRRELLMFTGIIEEVGAIRSVARGGKSAVLTVEAVRV